MKQSHEAVHRKRPELWPSNWILHHDNAPAHKVFSVEQFLTQKSIIEMKHPPYSPDLAPKWLLAVSRNKVCLKGTNISEYWRHPRNEMTALKAVWQQEFQNCSNSGSIIGLSAYLLKGCTSKVTPLIKFLVYTYACNEIILGTS
jgi:hypothetical protein